MIYCVCVTNGILQFWFKMRQKCRRNYSRTIHSVILTILDSPGNVLFVSPQQINLHCAMGKTRH